MNKPPENYPDIIYKYRNWKENYHKDILLQNNLYMASPKYFNDPFDCRIPTNYNLLDNPIKIREYVTSFVDRHRDFLISKGVNLLQEVERMYNDFSRNLHLVQADHERILFEKQDKHYGVLSLSMRWNSILMWSHYADNHTGFCIGFWEEKLRESALFGKGGPVNYNPENDYPVIDPNENENTMISGFKQTHNKAFDWEYEKEYRLNKLFFPDVPTEQDRTIKFPDNCFAEITIGLMTPENYKTEIIEAAKKKNIKIYQAKKVPFKFEIIRDEIT